MAQPRWSVGREFVLRAAASAPCPHYDVPLFRPFRAMCEMPAHFRAGEFGPAVPTARHARSRRPSTCALRLLQCFTAPILHCSNTSIVANGRNRRIRPQHGWPTTVGQPVATLPPPLLLLLAREAELARRRPVNPDEPDTRVSRLGAFKDKYVRNLSQLEKVRNAEDVHAAAAQAATSRVQTVVLIAALAGEKDWAALLQQTRSTRVGDAIRVKTPEELF